VFLPLLRHQVRGAIRSLRDNSNHSSSNWLGSTKPVSRRRVHHQVAHPASANYGKHWLKQKVADMFMPTPETVYAVKEWLSLSGVDLVKIKLSKSRNWMTFNATVGEAERLLQTEYHLYKHEMGHNHIACEEYIIPSHLTEHIDIVTLTVHFDTRISSPRRTRQHKDLPAPILKFNKKIKFAKRDAPQPHGLLGSPEDASNPKKWWGS
jgi:tripeptidyl-peptidase-1